MPVTRGSTPPARGTRPRNRRALILEAASELFAAKGYPQVAMADIADAVAVRPSALYRHFASKEDVLREAIRAFHLPTMAVLDHAASEPVESTLQQLAEVMLDHRWSGVLWQRESRHLPPEVRSEMAGAFQKSVGEFAKALQAHRDDLVPLQAELLSWASMSAMVSASFYRHGQSRVEEERLLASLAGAAASARIPTVRRTTTAATSEPGAKFHSRREALLAASIRLFAAHGYTAVSLEDVGAAIGIAGPSVYGYFAAKSDLLTTALNRGEAVMWMDMSRALTQASDAADALRRLLATYTQFAQESVDLVQLLRAEGPQLPNGQREAFAERQEQYVKEWVHLLRAARPDVSPATAEIRVHTTLNTVNAIARRPHLSTGKGVHEALQVIGRDVLQLG